MIGILIKKIKLRKAGPGIYLSLSICHIIGHSKNSVTKEEVLKISKETALTLCKLFVKITISVKNMFYILASYMPEDFNMEI